MLITRVIELKIFNYIFSILFVRPIIDSLSRPYIVVSSMKCCGKNRVEKRKGKMSIQEDRISKLPDVLLHQILASINLKEVVQTCILSKRFRYVWASLPSLNLDFQSYAIRSGVGLYYDEYIPRFLHFANQIISGRDTRFSVSNFRVSCNVTSCDARIVEKWVDYAIDHGVQELDIATYHGRESFKIPQPLFDCKTLRVLKLRYHFGNIIIPKPFVLPTVKVLHLDSFPFRDDDAFSFPKEPFSGFPNLEELILDRCQVSGLIVLGPKVRILELCFRGYHPGFSSEVKMEKIWTPRLNSIRFEGQVSLVCAILEELACLEEIYFDLYPILEAPYTDSVKQKMPLNLIRLLEQVGNKAKYVTLTSSTIEVLAMDPCLLEQTSSPFPNVKQLRLRKNRVMDSCDQLPQNVIDYLTKSH